MPIIEGGFPFNEENIPEDIGRDDNNELSPEKEDSVVFEMGQNEVERASVVLDQYIVYYQQAASDLRAFIKEHAEKLGMNDYTQIKDLLERAEEQVGNLRNKIQNKAYSSAADLKNSSEQLHNAFERIKRFKEKLAKANGTDLPLFDKVLGLADAKWKELWKIDFPADSKKN